MSNVIGGSKVVPLTFDQKRGVVLPGLRAAARERYPEVERPKPAGRGLEGAHR